MIILSEWSREYQLTKNGESQNSLDVITAPGLQKYGVASLWGGYDRDYNFRAGGLRMPAPDYTFHPYSFPPFSFVAFSIFPRFSATYF
jgi:hypothetical protein